MNPVNRAMKTALVEGLNTADLDPNTGMFFLLRAEKEGTNTS